tara:strand:- start:1101 stop:1358 length:258 start_codon:yes stop_codon:yes gene_type:complete
LALSCAKNTLRLFIPLQFGLVSKPRRDVSFMLYLLYESHVGLLSGGGPDGSDGGDEIPMASVTGLDGIEIPGIGLGLEPPPPMMF